MRYVLQPGYVISVNDGQRHYIGVGALFDLYCVPRDARTVVVGHGYQEQPGDVLCYPRSRYEDYPLARSGQEAPK